MATRDRAQVNAKKKGQKEVWRTGRVTVEVLRGRGLLALDKSGTSDPFVSVQLVDVTEGNPLKKPLDKVAKTGVCKKTLEPAWTSSSSRRPRPTTTARPTRTSTSTAAAST